MPDPSNAKQPADTAAADEHAAPHRADQVPVGVPPMRAAAGNGPARTRSSYSGDGAPAGACNDRVPLARSGSTTTNTRAQSLAQVGYQKKQQRPICGDQCASGALCQRVWRSMPQLLCLHDISTAPQPLLSLIQECHALTQLLLCLLRLSLVSPV